MSILVKMCDFLLYLTGHCGMESSYWFYFWLLSSAQAQTCISYLSYKGVQNLGESLKKKLHRKGGNTAKKHGVRI